MWPCGADTGPNATRHHVYLKLDFRFARVQIRGVRYVPRSSSDAVRRALRTFPAVLVTGSRQSGKTTFLRREFGASHAYVSLERPDVRRRAGEDPVGFLEDHAPPVILDEIQYIPQLLHYIKDRIDEDRRPGQWLLTGSQSFGLMHGISQSLAGRVAIFELDPLSTREVKGLPALSIELLMQKVFGRNVGQERQVAVRGRRGPDLADWLLRGGFPEPRLHPRMDRTVWFAAYVATYLERDVRNLTQVGDLNAFSRFVQLVAMRNGSLLNMVDLGRDAGISGPTVKQWLTILQASQLVHLLQPYHRNFGKRLVKSPKVYVTDPGLATYLLGLHSRTAVMQGPSLGALTESAVLGEWLKTFRAHGRHASIHFWRSSAGQEVDFILEHDGKLFAIEVKATATPTPRHADGLSAWLDLAGRGARAVLACRVEEPMTLRPGIRAVPWHLAW